MRFSKYTRKLAWSYKNNPAFESYIEKRLSKFNNNPIIINKDERIKK